MIRIVIPSSPIQGFGVYVIVIIRIISMFNLERGEKSEEVGIIKKRGKLLSRIFPRKGITSISKFL
jgi:hypothetical protein